jgi:hypothetical protein
MMSNGYGPFGKADKAEAVQPSERPRIRLYRRNAFAKRPVPSRSRKAEGGERKSTATAPMLHRDFFVFST